MVPSVRAVEKWVLMLMSAMTAKGGEKVIQGTLTEEGTLKLYYQGKVFQRSSFTLFYSGVLDEWSVANILKATSFLSSCKVFGLF